MGLQNKQCNLIPLDQKTIHFMPIIYEFIEYEASKMVRLGAQGRLFGLLHIITCLLQVV